MRLAVAQVCALLLYPGEYFFLWTSISLLVNSLQAGPSGPGFNELSSRCAVVTPSMLRHQIRVRYAETDQMGVAHHGAYVPWLEEARIEGMRSLGLSYRAMEERGIGMPVIDLHISYRSKLVFDDIVDIESHVEIAGQSRAVFHSTIKRDEQLCAQASVTVVTVNSEGRPIRIPDDILAFLHQAVC